MRKHKTVKEKTEKYGNKLYKHKQAFSKKEEIKVIYCINIKRQQNCNPYPKYIGFHKNYFKYNMIKYKTSLKVREGAN